MDVAHVGDGGEDSVQAIYDAEEPDAVADGEFEGDDTITDLELSEDVPVFGNTVGDRVSWNCYCDGAPTLTYIAQADGIRVTWRSVPDIEKQTERELEAALAGAGLVS